MIPRFPIGNQPSRPSDRPVPVEHRHRGVTNAIDRQRVDRLVLRHDPRFVPIGLERNQSQSTSIRLVLVPATIVG